MKTDIRLFIGGKEIEFNSDPNILFNYKVTDINNPTAVKNSFSKTIEIESTPKNNEAFQNIWNLQRVQFAGIDFNPIKKVDFVIYVNGDIYEKGYAKLDGITTKNNKCTYSITLFGGLGSFFFNLSYKDTEGDDKKTLGDLYYANRESYLDGTGVYSNIEPDLNFRINKDAVWDAWNQIAGDPDAVYSEAEADRPNNYYWNDKWNVINFAPAYNGIPDNFEASKCIVNMNNMPVFTFEKTDNGVIYSDYLGYIMGEQPNDELTEWETFDLRSYLQRPVVSMKRVIDACCNPLNNGGYEVILDNSFFNGNNPYYNEAYLTLPMLRENIEGGETNVSTEGSIRFKSGGLAGESAQMKHYYVDYEAPTTISQITNVNLGLGLDLTIPTNLSNDRLYLYTNFNATPSSKGNTDRVKSIERISSVSVQLVAYDALDNVAASSAVYFITDSKANGRASFEKDSLWYQSEVPVPSVTNIYGSFKKVANNTYRLVDGDDNPIILGFNFKTENPFSRLELKILPVTHEIINYMYAYKWWKSKEYNGVHMMEYHGVALNMFTQDSYRYNGDISVNSALNYGTYKGTDRTYIQDFQLVSKDYSELFSDTYVRKQDILMTEHTPADYLIGFAKMFGLYFYSNPAEESSNTELAPNGVIHIMTRDTYYTGEIVDLEKLINRDKGVKITPTTMNSKYFNFNVEQVDSECNKEHKEKYGYDYGYQKINTGYDFNADNKALLDKIPFKGGVEALETSKYYQRPVQGYPAYGWNGFVYTLFNFDGDEMETLDVDEGLGRIYRNSINPNGWDDTDAFKKPQFHEKDNGSIDGKDVLLFRSTQSWYDGSLNYWITDDIEEMVTLNEGKPCWIMTAEQEDVNGVTIAYPIHMMPKFERNIVYTPTNTIKHSWDFGNPFMTFVRNMYVGEQSGIYAKCWKDYISDLYSQDNRTLSTYVVFEERPNVDSLRKYYWFDGTLWRMNAIKDWNIGSFESTQVEFVKIIDEDNYRLTPITNTIISSFTFPNLQNVDEEFGGDDRNHYYRISSDAQNVKGVIDVGNAGSWAFGDGAYSECSVTWEDDTSEYYVYRDIMTPPADSGTGNAVKVFALTANTKNISRTWDLYIVDDEDRYYHVYIIQEGIPQKSLSISPNTIEGAAEGGVYEAQVYYQNRDGDDVSVDYNEDEAYQYFSWSLSEWNGDYATLTITFEPNTTTEAKTGAYLSLQAFDDGDVSASITINQEAGESAYDIEFEQYEVEFYAVGGGYEIGVVNDTTERWTATTDASWLSLDNQETYLGIECAAYEGESNRTALINITAETADNGTISKTITVTQLGIVGKILFNSSTLVPSLVLENEEGSTSPYITITMENIKSWYYSIFPSTFSLETNSQGTYIRVIADEANTTEQIIYGKVTMNFVDTNGNRLIKEILFQQGS